MAGEIILIVDDDPKIFQSISIGLLDYKLIPAYSGEEGLNILKARPDIDLILLDYTMPEMNGISFLKTIRADGCKVGVIFLTAFKERELLIECMENDASSFVEKPINFDLLSSKIKAVLKKTYRNIQNKNIAKECIEQVKNILSKQEGQKLDLQDFANKYNWNTKYFSRVFKRFAGKTFSQYRLELRMKSACELIKNKEITINKVSSILGYINPSAFRKTFKKYQGVTAKEYRVKN
ncbi:response regulator [Candidatus Margulisiibacteriota bacterium]